MEKADQTYLFHISRKDGSSFFLDPFQDTAEIIQVLENTRIVGLYGNEPRVEAVTHFRNELYRTVEQAVKIWVAERRFIPRFLISSGVFLFAYLFFSLVIRDPVPMIDELLIALGASGAVYFILSRRDLSSVWSSRKRAELRQKVDAIYFAEDQFVREVEKNLHRVETESPQQVLESLIAPTDNFYSHLNPEAAADLLRYIEARLGSRELKKQEKRIRDLARSAKTGGGKDLQYLSRQFGSKKMDLSLFALYHGIKLEEKQGK